MKKKIIVLAALLFSMSVNAQNAVGNWSLLGWTWLGLSKTWV